MGGVGATLVAAAAAPGGRKDFDAAMLIGGTILIFLALGWLQWLVAIAFKGINRVAEKARSDQDAATAIRLLRSAIGEISTLPIRETGEMKWAQLLPMLMSSRSISEAGTIYRRRHRAATIHAIRVALRAGAIDNGALQLAEQAHVDTELLELKAELLRIVLELSQGPEFQPAKA
jgi:hypothetical protein